MKTIKDLELKLKGAKEREVRDRIVDRPSLDGPYKHLATLLARRGEHEQAVAVLKLALSVFPRDRLIREQLAGVYEEMGKSASAVDLYKQLVKEGESWSAHVRLARIYKRRGKLPEAVAVFKDIPRTSPLKERSYAALYELYFVMDEHQQGIQNLKEAIRVFGATHRRIKDLGRLYMKVGRKKDAIEFLTQAVKIRKDDMDAVKWIGLAYLDLGDYASARRTFNRILKTEPESYQAMIQLAELCLLEEKLDEAKDWLDRIRAIQKQKREPWDSRSKLAMGEYRLKKGEFKKAAELTEDGLSETPFYYPMEVLHAHSILEAAYRGLGDEFKLGVHGRIREALGKNLDVFGCLTGLALELEKKKDLAAAKEVLEQLLVTFPGNTLVLVNMAEAQFKRGMSESAVQLARAATKTAEGSFLRDKIEALKLVARISRARGHEAAARDYERQAEKLEKGK
ncbi:MAG TPA: tetratricopeptide repeat protein [bacterium]|nr:tetratricopeptide repeat protein [bacterium]HPQ66770.1 tetratricopeptide repeat protein [bacterium]